MREGYIMMNTKVKCLGFVSIVVVSVMATSFGQWLGGADRPGGLLRSLGEAMRNSNRTVRAGVNVLKERLEKKIEAFETERAAYLKQKEALIQQIEAESDATKRAALEAQLEKVINYITVLEKRISQFKQQRSKLPA